MKRFFLLLSLALLTTVSMKGQSFFGARSLTPVSVDKLSDEEILLFKRNFQTQNLTEPEALNDLKQRGLPEGEMRKLKERLTRLDALGQEEQLQMMTIQMMQLQDSLADAKRSQMELSALERLYALDSNVFGAELFRNEKMDFAPNLRIATPPTYRLGPDDVLEITVYGYQEFNKSFKIMPDGAINVPYAGVVSVIGLTIKEAKAKINQLLAGNGYNTLRTGQSQLTISLKEIRSVDVTVVGGKIPGRYTIPAIASPYHVLHLAGGPAAKGSYRSIRLMRNGEQVATIDLYELLVNGTKHDDIRLEDGDVIFIPTYEARVTLAGEFKRPRTFELLGEESLQDLLTYSGGFTEQAYKGKVYVERISAVGFVSHVVGATQFGEFAPQNGDFIFADTLNDRFRNRISITGGVQIPGYYGISEGLTLEGLVALAGGYREDAAQSQAVIARKDLTGRWSYRSVASMEQILQEGDSVVVGYSTQYDAHRMISVSGEVNTSVEFNYGEGLTLANAITLAGGFTDFADHGSIEVGRMGQNGYQLSRHNLEDAVSFLLEPGDVVTVKKVSAYRVAPVVFLSGEVHQEGGFALTSRNESLQSVLNRAGGMTAFADSYGAMVLRTSSVQVERKEAGQDEEQTNLKPEYKIDTISILPRHLLKSTSPFVLKDGDQVLIPEKKLTVAIQGAVFNPGRVSFLPNKSFRYYLKMGGGSGLSGMPHKAYVVYPNGRAQQSRHVGHFVYQRPKVVPGSTIVVPEKDQTSGFTVDPQVAAVYTGVLSAISTATIGIITLLRP